MVARGAGAIIAVGMHRTTVDSSFQTKVHGVAGMIESACSTDMRSIGLLKAIEGRSEIGTPMAPVAGPLRRTAGGIGSMPTIKRAMAGMTALPSVSEPAMITS